MDLPVLVEQRLWSEFADALAAVGDTFTASSGRTYRIEATGGRAEVFLVRDDLAPPPPSDDVDADLLELACAVYDAVGGDWTGDALRAIASLWGWDVSRR